MPPRPSQARNGFGGVLTGVNHGYFHIIEDARNRGIRLADRDLSPLYLRKPCDERLGDIKREGFDQITLAAHDDAFNDGEGNSVMNCSVNIVAFQRVALINIQNGIDIESLSELVFFIEDTVMRKKAQFMMRIVYTGFTSYC